MGDFLKLEWKKFILPVILIILFLVVINNLRISGSIGDKYDCQIITLVQNSVDNANKNDTTAVIQTDSEMKLLSQNKQKETRLFQYSDSISAFVKIIDPIVPFPCENLGKNNVCSFYINKETYDCFKNLDLSRDAFSQPKMDVYKPVSLWIILLNILILFVEGYLISAIILLIYRKIRNKSDEVSSVPYSVPSSM